MVMRRGATESASARDALGELAGRYWYPVYIYVRRCGHAPEAAGNIARRFLQQLLREVDDRSAQPSQGHYRSYLLSRLHTFLAAGPVDESSPATEPAMPPGRSPSAQGRSASAAEATDGRERPAEAMDGLERPNDLELRYQRDHLDQLSPEQSYQRAFALQILHRTLRRLTDEARQTGHLPMFERLEQFLARDPAPGEYESIATHLKVRPLTLVMALKRMRQRFRELAAEELVDTVATEEDLAGEQDALLSVLGGANP
jgi:RNA polymerase sigma-70 factor (ECF subfamily)